MSLYAIKRREDGWYVARSGLERSYTRRVEEIQFFSSFDAADKARCENEYVIELKP